jgi:hypothetical protein
MKNRLPRQFYIPQGAIKVSDKKSSAVAYLYQGIDGPSVVAFHGKADKPDFRFYYPTAEKRAAKVRAHFDAIRSNEQRRKDAAASRKAFVHDYQVGEVLVASWGYEQTNIDFYQITAVIGKQVELRKISVEAAANGSMSGHVVPSVGQFIGEPTRHLAQEGRIKIDNVRTARRAEFHEVAGVKIYRAYYESSYH